MNYKTSATRLSNMKWGKETYTANLILNDLMPYMSKLNLTGAWQEIDRTTTSSVAKTSRDSHGYNIGLQTEWLLFDSHYVTFGGEYISDEVKQRVLSGVNRGKYTDATVTNSAVYLQDEWSIGDFILTAGGRQTWYSAEIDKTTQGFPQDDISKSRFVGALGVVYTGFDDISLRAQYSQGFKAPSLYHTLASALPNPDLKPETSDNFEIGMLLSKGGLDVDFAVFYSKTKDYITAQRVGMLYEYSNMDEAETYGAELDARYKISALTIYSDVAFLDRTYFFNNASRLTDKTDKTRTPPWSGKSGIKWENELFDRTFFIDVNVVWAGSSESEASKQVVTEYHGWAVYNLKAGMEKKLEDINYHLVFEWRNIGDKLYYPANGSTLLAQPGSYFVLSGGFTF